MIFSCLGRGEDVVDQDVDAALFFLDALPEGDDRVVVAVVTLDRDALPAQLGDLLRGGPDGPGNSDGALLNRPPGQIHLGPGRAELEGNSPCRFPGWRPSPRPPAHSDLPSNPPSVVWGILVAALPIKRGLRCVPRDLRCVESSTRHRLARYYLVSYRPAPGCRGMNPADIPEWFWAPYGFTGQELRNHQPFTSGEIRSANDQSACR